MRTTTFFGVLFLIAIGFSFLVALVAHGVSLLRAAWVPDLRGPTRLRVRGPHVGAPVRPFSGGVAVFPVRPGVGGVGSGPVRHSSLNARQREQLDRLAVAAAAARRQGPSNRGPVNGGGAA